MSELTPCPQCNSERVWARAALGAFGVTHVAFCPGCARAATICTRCGTELVVVRPPDADSLLQCPACRPEVTAAPSSRPLAGPTRWSPVAPQVLQRVADDSEQLADSRYARRRQLVGLLDAAARRADALARLEFELDRLEDPAED